MKVKKKAVIVGCVGLLMGGIGLMTALYIQEEQIQPDNPPHGFRTYRRSPLLHTCIDNITINSASFVAKGIRALRSPNN